MKYLPLYLTLAPLLVACGGGGDGGGGSSSPAAPIATVTSTSDLVAPDGFDYNPIESRSLNVDISAHSQQRAYLSVYRHYFEVDGKKIPDYGSRIAAVQLDSGKASIDLSIADSEDDLLAEIWFYDGSDPLQKDFYAYQQSWSW